MSAGLLGSQNSKEPSPSGSMVEVVSDQQKSASKWVCVLSITNPNVKMCKQVRDLKERDAHIGGEVLGKGSHHNFPDMYN